jgi:hypothetical protein
MGSFHEATQAQMHIVEVEREQERAPYKEGECEERTCALTYMARSLLPEDDVVKASSPNAVTPSVAANTLNHEATVYKVRSPVVAWNSPSTANDAIQTCKMEE